MSWHVEECKLREYVGNQVVREFTLKEGTNPMSLAELQAICANLSDLHMADYEIEDRRSIPPPYNSPDAYLEREELIGRNNLPKSVYGGYGKSRAESRTVTQTEGNIKRVIDKFTGEILREYETMPYNPDNHKASVSPDQIKDYEMLQDYAKAIGWKKTHKEHFNPVQVGELFDTLEFNRFLFTLSMIEWGNIVVTSSKELQEKWDVSRYVVVTALNKWHSRGYIKYTTSGLRKRSTVRIEVNPELYHKGPRSLVVYDNHMAGHFIKDAWGMHSEACIGKLTGKTPEQRMQNLCNPLSNPPHWEGDVKMPASASGERLEALLGMSDVELSLMNTGAINFEEHLDKLQEECREELLEEAYIVRGGEKPYQNSPQTTPRGV